MLIFSLWSSALASGCFFCRAAPRRYRFCRQAWQHCTRCHSITALLALAGHHCRACGLWCRNGCDSATYGHYAALAAGCGRVRLILSENRARISVPGTCLRRLFWSILAACAGFAVLMTIGIVLSVLFEALVFFSEVSPLRSSTACNGRQRLIPPRSASCRCWPARLLITLIAITIAGPLGLFAAIYMAEYASPKMRGMPSRCWKFWLACRLSCLAFLRRSPSRR